MKFLREMEKEVTWVKRLVASAGESSLPVWIGRVSSYFLS
jgi:hypothetical protein